MLGLWGVPPRSFIRRSKFIALLLSSLLFPARSELPLEDLLSISETELMSSVFPGASLEAFSLILSMPWLKNHRMLTSLLLRSRVLCLEFLVRHFLRIRLSGVSLFPHHLISGGVLMPPPAFDEGREWYDTLQRCVLADAYHDLPNERGSI